MCCHGFMQFNHDNMIGVRLAEELVNLVEDDLWDLGSVLIAVDRARVRLDGLPQHLDVLREWTVRLKDVFEAGHVPTRCHLINEMLTISVSQVQLALHDDLPPHLHFVSEEEGIVEQIRALTVGGLAVFAVESHAERMGVCNRPTCSRVYIDTSRGGRRAYCSSLCGNHHAVIRLRERKQTSPTPPRSRPPERSAE